MLADLGLAIDSTFERPTTRLGTLEYMPPEILEALPKRSPTCHRDMRRPSYDITADLWSVGVLAWEALVGSSPFSDRSKETIRHNIGHKVREVYLV